MAVKQVDISRFLSLSAGHPVLDVRSPAEFKHAHIPGAYSLPLFTDAERKVVGTTYKQESREKAIKSGLDYFGPKMRGMVEEVEQLLGSLKKASPDAPNIVLVHCWRGGMRSAGVAWLLDLYGFTVYTLVGGYKAFRKFAISQFEVPYTLKVVGGYTGSGKTAILNKLSRLGKTVIDLEMLANHKGSAFGHLGLPDQPSQEMFENKLAMALFQLSSNNDATAAEEKPIWLEDESMRIGTVMIPNAFYRQMRQSPCYFLDIPFGERLQYIVKDYGKADRDKLINAILRIQKRLGGLETKTAINCIIEKDIAGAFAILLKYYDKWYLKGLHSREPGGPPVVTIPSVAVDDGLNASLLLNQLT
ncbi:tRNA 2-selenouridine(34) synthase MnmH [Flavihumibacter fluvii]|uniref:tRNA 2-selenouridine(34) synthase MnmH n=1 Tax=Flavihumibacter fluvii TaxID=2838157 RepID=UPI001BDEDB6E|nr:tRNA 2-selenouridine(34) synthase MnmH [Flavihumibacter fluvii]ULQ51836.1 tRNA 2-selenouridine(34) synthase MnmH [Flavihumibacter fluvii]